ncbi:MAG TPA: response regulator transcription factor [Streptosporangiaceae bacterium]|nr:response regulator transcription factor [Streptosporangiaceae bacterium]
MTIRVLLADDQPLIRTALRMVITDTDDIEVAGEAGTGAEAVELAGSLHPDVVVMDIRMPGMDGIEATRRIMAGRDPGTPAHVVVLTTFDHDEYVYAALRAGASGFLVKDMALEEILAAVRTVAAGDALIAPAVTRRLIEDFARRPEPVPAPAPAGGQRAVGGITERERDVLTLIGRGLSNTEIAADLTLSIATVKTYVTRLLTKLDARDRVQLVIIAYDAGLVAPAR